MASASRLLLDQAKLSDADPGADLSGVEIDDTSWLDIDVPGDLHRALQRAGRLPDLNRGGETSTGSWVEDREWWWRVRFATGPRVAGERLELIAHGLDTFATVYLNGSEIGRHHNMFRPASWDITNQVRPENVLAICFRQPLVEVDTGDDANPRNLVARMRKTQLSYGWDFAPRRPAVGPWLPIEIVRRTAPSIDHMMVQTVGLTDDHRQAEVKLTVAVTPPSTVMTATIQLHDPSGAVIATASGEVSGRSEFSFTLNTPTLWWTHDRGRPDRYTAVVNLTADGQTIDSRRTSFGVRTIALDRSEDEHGRSFRFVLNGEALAVSGANWVPTDLAIAEPDADRYQSLLTRARAANMNMVRVWGGGIYEHDVFYDLCDELGVLVWQDFMFACSAFYDDADPEWLAEIEAEARHQVRRLASHPSLALWCGNNEVAILAELLLGAGARPGDGIFENVLARSVAAEDGITNYITTTPLVGPSNEVDRHCWTVWHGIDERRTPAIVGAAGRVNNGTPVDPASAEAVEFVAQAGPHGYLGDDSRFTSEYGLASAPSLETLRRWTAPEHVVLGDSQITSRLSPASRGPVNKFDLLCAAIAGPPKDIVDYCELSQLAHAEGLKIGMERYRRGWPRCGGSLIWMLNDCWPATSWSLIDFDGRPKPAYHYARRAFAPILASFAPHEDGVSLWLTNNSRDPISDELRVRQVSFDGDVLWRASVEIDVAPSSSNAIFELPPEALTQPRTSYLEVRSRSGSIAANHHFGTAIHDLERVVVLPSVDVRYDGPQTRVTLTASQMCLVTHLTVAGRDVEWSDDYFTLGPHESHTVTANAVIAPGDITVRCR